MVFQDGVRSYLPEDKDFRTTIVFDNLIARKEMPVTIGVFIDPGYKRTELPPATENVPSRRMPPKIRQLPRVSFMTRLRARSG